MSNTFYLNLHYTYALDILKFGGLPAGIVTFKVIPETLYIGF